MPSPAHQTVVLAASSNDNGLLHQELVDFQLPPGLGWTTRGAASGAAAGTGTSSGAASGAGARTNDVSMCLDPFPWIGADRRAGRAAEVTRRVQLHQFWKASAKFQLPTRVPAEGAVLSAGLRAAAPCALRFGSESGPPEGDFEQCRYSFPQGERTAPSLSKGCWAWCEGTLSSSNARVSLVQTRLPT